jgi:transcriptional regulator with XRE-family HTH domain
VPSDTSHELGDTIRAVRIDRGFTQESFAAQVDLDRSYYGAIERGEHSITVEMLVVVADGLGMQAWELLRRAGV